MLLRRERNLFSDEVRQRRECFKFLSTLFHFDGDEIRYERYRRAMPTLMHLDLLSL